MIPLKRRHGEHSAASTSSSAGQRHGRTTPSLPWTSPFGHSQQPSQQQPRTRVSLRPPSSQQPSASLISPRTPPNRRSPFQTAEGNLLPEDETSIEERENADALHEVIMCVDMRDRGTVGCAYYVARDEKLFLMADVTSGGTEVIETCKLPLLPRSSRLNVTSEVARSTHCSHSLNAS